MVLPMAGKEKYISPVVLKRVSLFLEGTILAGSVVNNSTSVKTAGQQVVEYNFSDPSFNSGWE
jgi:hypothetical protein